MDSASLDLWRFRIVLATAAGIPVLLLPLTNDPVNVPKLGLLAVGTGTASFLWLLGLLADRRRPQASRLLVAPAVALLLPLAIAWLFSPYKGWAAVGHYPRFMGLVPYALTVLFALLVADTFTGRVRYLVEGLSVAAAVAAGYGLLQVFHLDPLGWTTVGVASSTLGNSNFTGGFLAIAVPLVIGLWFEGSRPKGLVMGAGALVLAGLIATRSEGAWAAAAAGGLLSLGFYARPRWSRAPLVGSLAALAIALAIVGGVVATVASDDVPFSLRTVDRRGDWWVAAIGMAADHPVAGRGPNSFAIENPRYQPSDYAALASFTDDPHSVPLAFLASNGFLGLGWLVSVGLLIKLVVPAHTQRPFVTALLGAGAAYLVQALLSVDTVALRTAGWTVAAGLAAAMIDPPVRGKKKRPGKRPPDVPGRPFLVALGGAICLLVVWWGGNLMVADARFLTAQRLLSDGDGTQALAKFEGAIALRPDVNYRRVYGLSVGRTAISVAESGEEDLANELFARSDEQLRFVDDVPHVPTMLEYAELLARRSELDAALTSRATEMYRRLASIAERDPDILLPAARFLITSDESSDVEQMLAPVAAELQHPEIWGLLAEARALSGDSAGARLAAQRALALDTNQTEAMRALELLPADG